MKWTVKGVDRATGTDSTIVVEADNEAIARDRASQYGVLVEAIGPVQSARPVPVIDYSSRPTTTLTPGESPAVTAKLPPAPRGMNVFERSMFTLLMVGGFIGVGMGYVGATERMPMDYAVLVGGRFDSSYAPGATANAVEKLAHDGALPFGTTAPIVGVLFWIVAALVSINAHVRDAARRN